MKHKIQILDKNIANQIAAGEVAERPTLILKELIENSLDAGATSIRVLLKDSGFTQMRVIDNGEGIPKNEIHTAFLRHATSKLQTMADLESLYTMGFRGEALASIAAVAKVKITTKTAGQDSGFSSEISDGSFGELVPAPCNDGTEITVDDLFYNTPARKKFLATPTRELRDISDLTGKIMIANPDAAFELSNNGKTIFRSNGNGKMKDAILSVYGRELVKNLISLEDDLFHGYICHPGYHKPNRSYYHFYINHRYIQNDTLNRTLEEAYRTLMPERRFPVAFIDIAANPADYDINVHPNKLEVKFHHGSVIPQRLYDELKRVLSGAERFYDMAADTKGYFAAPESVEDDSGNKVPVIHQEKPDKFADGRNKMGFSDLKSVPAEQQILTASEQNSPPVSAKQEDQTSDSLKKMPLQSKLSSDFKKISDTVDMSLLHLMDKDERGQSEISEDETDSPPEITAEQLLSVDLFRSPEELALREQFDACEKSQKLNLDESFYSSLEVLGQLAASFIIAAGSDALYIIDQHAAHERLLYNKIRKVVSRESNDTQPLLVPLEINVNYKQFSWMIENIIAIRDLGFVLEEFGDQCFILREVPIWAKDIDHVAFLLELADGLIEEGSPLTVENIKDSRIMTRACKSAIKANRYLTRSDIHFLFSELDMAEDAFTCPHGRPITIKYSVAEIRRKFLRT